MSNPLFLNHFPFFQQAITKLRTDFKVAIALSVSLWISLRSPRYLQWELYANDCFTTINDYFFFNFSLNFSDYGKNSFLLSTDFSRAGQFIYHSPSSFGHFALHCEQRFLFCMYFSVYEVVRVACQLSSHLQDPPYQFPIYHEACKLTLNSVAVFKAFSASISTRIASERAFEALSRALCASRLR